MNKPSSEGESSCKRQENGDGSSGSDRPLKKARFAWQVKGKYHLKNELTDNGNSSAADGNSSVADTTEPEPFKCHEVSREIPQCVTATESVSENKTQFHGHRSVTKQYKVVHGSMPKHSKGEKVISSSDSDTDSDDLAGNAEQNLEILGDYLFKQDFNTLGSVITDIPDEPVLEPSPNYTELLPLPKCEYICDFDPTSQTKSNVVPDNVSPPGPLQQQRPSLSEDQCIARWQARQMAKGFVDNTINRVLDSWMVTPIPPETDDNRSIALDVAEFINNLPSGNSIENEGILMAISAHGLQNTSNSSTSSIEDDIPMCTSDNLNAYVFPSPPSSPASSEVENMIELTKINDGDDNNKSTNDSHNICPNSRNTQSHYSTSEAFDENLDSLSEYPDANQSSSENDDMKIIYCDESSTNNDEIFTNDFDFMDAAVTFAIQNKGLTSYENEYG